MSDFPALAIRTVGGGGWDLAKFPRTSAHMSSTRQPSDQAARNLMLEIINSNCGGKFTFSPHSPLHLLLPQASVSSSSPRLARKTLTPNLASHLQTLAMASSGPTPSMVASSEAAAKPASSIVMPPEGLVIPASAVIETTDGDHNLAALDPLEE